MMPTIPPDTSPVPLTLHIDDDTLLVSYEGTTIGDAPLVLELDTFPATEVLFTDFVQDELQYAASAFTIVESGLLEAWVRIDSTVKSGPLTHGAEDELALDVVVIAVAHNTEPPLTPRQLADFEPAAYTTRIRVKIRKKGSKPE